VVATVVPEDRPQLQALQHSLQAVAVAVRTEVVEMVVVEVVDTAQYYQPTPTFSNMKPLQVLMALAVAAVAQLTTAQYMATVCQAAAASLLFVIVHLAQQVQWPQDRQDLIHQQVEWTFMMEQHGHLW
jgi:hypothetical protein